MKNLYNIFTSVVLLSFTFSFISCNEEELPGPGEGIVAEAESAQSAPTTGGYWIYQNSNGWNAFQFLSGGEVRGYFYLKSSDKMSFSEANYTYSSKKKTYDTTLDDDGEKISFTVKNNSFIWRNSKYTWDQQLFNPYDEIYGKYVLENSSGISSFEFMENNEMRYRYYNNKGKLELEYETLYVYYDTTQTIYAALTYGNTNMVKLTRGNGYMDFNGTRFYKRD